MATITSTNPIVESYQYWWIEKVTISAEDPSGVISCQVVLRLCRVCEAGIWHFHPTYPPQTLNIPDVMAVANENMSVAYTMGALIDTIANMARQAGIIQ